MRRFLQHVLPKGLHKVRYFGLWHPSKRSIASKARLLLHMQRANDIPPQVVGNSATSVEHPHQSSTATADLPICPPCGLGQLPFVRKLLPKQPQGPCRGFGTQSVIGAGWARHALALSSSRFLDHFRPRGTLARHARPCRAPRFCRTSTVLIQFSSPPALPSHPCSPEISI